MQQTGLVDLSTFRRRHIEALELDQPRHNLMLGLLGLASADASNLNLWSFGEGTQCALQSDGRNIVLSDLTPANITLLAATLRNHAFPGIVGPDQMPELLAHALQAEGIQASLSMPQRILALHQAPIFPGCPGHARPMQESDLSFYPDWVLGFYKDTSSPEAPPPREKILAEGMKSSVRIWEVAGEPVSMAQRSRDTRDGACINGVYTPDKFRGRGYAGAITAALSAEIFASGKSLAFLYTDSRNPFSNRAYEKVGYRFHCLASHWVRGEL